MADRDPVAALEALVTMKERGLVTAEEYNAKRAEIVGSINAAPVPPASPVGAAPTPPPAAPPAKRSGNPLVGLIVLLVVVWLVWPKGGGGSTSPATEPVNAPGVVATPASNMTRSQANAVETAQAYLRTAAFSRSGLIDQLEFEGYPAADATFAVDYLRVDWKEQAWKSAEAYLKTTSFSRSGLIDQLKYEGFSTDEATYGVTRAGL